jgi:hypothetical protein
LNMTHDIGLTWNTDMANPQAIFDRVAAHLQSARKRSVQDDANICAYRGVNGAMCAVGVLLDGESVPECSLAELLRFMPPDRLRYQGTLAAASDCPRPA